MAADYKSGLKRAQIMLMETFGLGRAAALGAVLSVVFAVICAGFWFFHSAPPSTLIITSGPEGSAFQKNAERYRKILARSGVKLRILPSEGSQENLKRLADPSFRVDVGFVQGGETQGFNIDKLVSLGSLYHQPLSVFYQGSKPVNLLSQLKGKRLAIGPVGSGGHALALALLSANGIKPGGVTHLEDLDAQDAVAALLRGKVDAAFLMGDSASSDLLRTLMRTPRVHLLDFTQADAYTRHFPYLNKMEMSKGSIDFGKDIPAQDIHLIGATVELIAREKLHPALSDLLLEAAREVHSNAGLFRRQGEFPALQEHEFRLSDDAIRFYKSGKSFLYRSLPFWLASLAIRILTVFVPLVVILVPALKLIPAAYRWRINVGMFKWYRALLEVEQDMAKNLTPENRKELLARLNRIETEVNKMKVPAPFAGQFYELRGHVDFVRNQLTKSAG